MILIAGPCVIESKDILRQTVESLLEAIDSRNIDFTFKSSWRKDNRTLKDSFDGLDPLQAICYMKDISKEYNVKICTDIHVASDLKLLDGFDIIQIPAYLAKQQSLLKAAASHINYYNDKSKKIKLHIKKPQFVDAQAMIDISKNAFEYGVDNIILTDRGTMYGPDKVFMDPRNVNIMQKSGFPVLCDVTHPNKNYSANIVNNVEILAKSYLAAGANGIFLETHPNCKSALCDAETMYPTENLKNFINSIF